MHCYVINKAIYQKRETYNPMVGGGGADWRAGPIWPFSKNVSIFSKHLLFTRINLSIARVKCLNMYINYAF